MKKYLYLILVLVLVGFLAFVNFYEGGIVSDGYSKLDTVGGRIGENTSRGAMQIYLDGSGANYTYYFSEDAELKGDLVLGNHIYAVIGTLEKDNTEKRFVAFWNKDDSYSKTLGETMGLWLHKDTSMTAPQVGVELLMGEKISTHNIPSRLYTQWRILGPTTLVFEGFSQAGAPVHDTVETNIGADSSSIYIKALDLKLEFKQ